MIKVRKRTFEITATSLSVIIFLFVNALVMLPLIIFPYSFVTDYRAINYVKNYKVDGVRIGDLIREKHRDNKGMRWHAGEGSGNYWDVSVEVGLGEGEELRYCWHVGPQKWIGRPDWIYVREEGTLELTPGLRNMEYEKRIRDNGIIVECN